MLTRFEVAAGSTLYVPFCSYDANGASVTLSGLAVTDIEIYKNGSVTQRAVDNGYALLDTDGIDFDGITGLNGFSIDLSDNTSAGFFAAGSEYWVIVSAVTVDAQTVNFIACWFRITDALDVSDVLSLLTLVRSDTTHIESDGAAIELIVSDVQSDTNKLISDATEADASDIISLLTKVYSDTTHIDSDITSNATRIQQIQSDVISNATRATTVASNVLIIKSDTSDIRSHIAIWEGAAGLLSDINSGIDVIQLVTSDIQSDTNVIITKLTENDTSDILSLLTVLDTRLKGLVLWNGTIGATGNDTTHLHIPAISAYADDDVNNYYLAILDVSTGLYYVRQITDFVTSTDLVTVGTLPFTPQASTDLYWILSEQSGAAGGGSLTSDQDSKLTKIATAIVEVDTSDIQSLLTKVYSDTTAFSSSGLSSDQDSKLTRVATAIVEVDTSDLMSMLTLIRSDTTHIESDAVRVLSDTTAINTQTTRIDSDQISQYTVIHSDTGHIESDAVRILSDTTHIDSDTTHIESDCAADQIVLSDVQSDTNKLVSDATEIDTSDIHSLLTLVRSDTAVVEAFGAPPAAASIAAAVLAVAYEGAETVQHFFRLARAVLYGKASGMNGPSAAFRDKTDAKDRVVAAVDGGDRDTPTLDPS